MLKGDFVKNLFVFLSASALLFGCGEREVGSQNTSNTSAAKVETVINKPTLNDWRSDFLAVHERSHERVTEDGMKKFNICEKLVEGGKCGGKAIIGTTDPFRSISHFEGAVANIYRDMVVSTVKRYNEKIVKLNLMAPYIAVKECSAPIMFMRLNYINENWIFVNSIAMVSHGEKIWSQDIENDSVVRTVEKGGVREETHIVLDGEKISAITNALNDSDVMIRLYGKSEYVPLKKSEIESLRDSWMEMIDFWNLVNLKLKDKYQGGCNG